MTTTYAYNTGGLLSGTTYSDTTPAVTLTYDRQGRVLTTTDAAGMLTRTYHASGQLQNETYSGGLLDTLGITRSFDMLNRQNGRGLPAASLSTVYAYDDASRLLTVTAGANSATYGYAANANLIETIALKNNGTTRMTTTRTFDRLNRLASITNVLTGATVSHAYDYNAANQRTKATLADGSYWSYGYDALGQVINSTKYQPNATAILGHAFGWTFDDIGNRLTAATKGWGRPNAAAEPGMQWVAIRTSRNIWHDVTIIVSCKDGEPSFQEDALSVSKFPSFRLWQDGKPIDERRQGALSDLWQADPGNSSFVAP